MVSLQKDMVWEDGLWSRIAVQL